MKLPLLTPAPIPKPPHGSRCNGCGTCCSALPCHLALDFLSADPFRPCPALEFAAGRFWCGLVADPAKYLGFVGGAAGKVREMIGDALGIGRGCDSTMEVQS